MTDDEVQHLMVLDDRSTFGGLHGCRIYEMPAAWDSEEIEDALGGEGDLSEVFFWPLDKFEPVEIDGSWYLKIGTNT